MAMRHLAGLIGLLVFAATPVCAAPMSMADFLGPTVEFVESPRRRRHHDRPSQP